MLSSSFKGLFYCDGHLYVPNGPTQLQILQARHDALAASHFGIIGGHSFENV
jgi:hypothetical protein